MSPHLQVFTTLIVGSHRDEWTMMPSDTGLDALAN